MADPEVIAEEAPVPTATPRPLLNCSALADDGQVELALMATSHPDITAFGKVVFDHMKEANALLATCAPWQEQSKFPADALETYRSAKAFAASLLKQLERLDCIDLEDLKPDWGDKETVRLARRSAIGFAQQILDRLDGIQALLAAPAEKLKQERAATATAATPEAEVSLQDKYRDMFLANASSAAPAAKRQRTQPATKAEVEALLKRIRAKTKQEILRQPNKAFYRRLVSLAGVGELPQTPALCKDAVECMVSAAVCAVESAPSGKVLGKLFHSLQQLQELSPTELPGILLDMADAVRGLP